MTDAICPGSEAPRTHFADPNRVTDIELLRSVESVNNNQVIDGVMQSVGGLIAVLNEQRQILAVNTSFLQSLGLGQDAGNLLGLRVGEAIACEHAHDMPAGCGTSRHCITCGAAIAMVSSLSENLPVEKDCLIETFRAQVRQDLFLRVRAAPLEIGDTRFLLLFLKDVSEEKKRASLERAFFHDIGGIIGGLVGTADLMDVSDGEVMRELADDMVRLSNRLADEFEIQRLMMYAEQGTFHPEKLPVPIDTILEEVGILFSGDPVAAGKGFVVRSESPRNVIESDGSLLFRILTNMVKNAFEASVEGDEIRLWVESDDEERRFCVWNRTAIPENVALRIFQRNFTTKGEPGRGLGTFSMKLLGEQFLGGIVDFTSSESEGTVFRLHFPV